MQWNWDTADNVSGFIKFNAATTVAVAKVCLPTAADSTTYKVNTSFPHETAIGSLDTCECDGDMSCVPAAFAADSDETHIYGHATLAIRHRPHCWYHTSYASKDSRIDATCDNSNLNDNPPWVRTVTRLNKAIHWYNSNADFLLESDMYLPVVNGMNERRKVTGSVYMSSHYYVDDSVTMKVNNNRLIVGWTFSDGGIGGRFAWQPSEGNPHNYSPKLPYIHLEANTYGKFGITARLTGSYKEGSNGAEIGLRIWPRHLYLYF